MVNNSVVIVFYAIAITVTYCLIRIGKANGFNLKDGVDLLSAISTTIAIVFLIIQQIKEKAKVKEETRKSIEAKSTIEYNRCLDFIFRQVELTHGLIEGVTYLNHKSVRVTCVMDIITSLQPKYTDESSHVKRKFHSIYQVSRAINKSVDLCGQIIDGSINMGNDDKNALKNLLAENLYSKVIGFYELVIPVIDVNIKHFEEFVAAKDNYQMSHLVHILAVENNLNLSIDRSGVEPSHINK